MGFNNTLHIQCWHIEDMYTALNCLKQLKKKSICFLCAQRNTLFLETLQDTSNEISRRMFNIVTNLKSTVLKMWPNTNTYASSCLQCKFTLLKIPYKYNKQETLQWLLIGTPEYKNCDVKVTTKYQLFLKNKIEDTLKI